jgi:hypothetical protein
LLNYQQEKDKLTCNGGGGDFEDVDYLTLNQEVIGLFL